MELELQKATIEQLGFEVSDLETPDSELCQTLGDIARGGADAGFHGFTYYHETVKFFTDNRKAVYKLASDLAEDCGESLFTMIKGFRCLNGDYSEQEVAEVLYGQADRESEAYTAVANALAWFALETLANEVVNY